MQAIQGAGNKFAINSTTGEISSVTGAIDFENPVDNGYDNKYDFTVLQLTLIHTVKLLPKPCSIVSS